MADVISATMQMQEEKSLNDYTTLELLKELTSREGVELVEIQSDCSWFRLEGYL